MSKRRFPHAFGRYSLAALFALTLAGVIQAQTFYLTFSSSSTIRKYSAAGTILDFRSTGGTLYGGAVDNSNNVYAVDLNGGVARYPNGMLLTGGSNLSTSGTTPFYYGVATDSAGNVYVTSDNDTGASSDVKVYKYALGAGNPTLFSDTVANTSFSVRNAIAADPVTGNVFVANNFHNLVLEYGPPGGTTSL